MAIQIPINPKVLIWARERAGFSFEEMQSHYKKLPDWETGASYPTYTQLEQLAQKYHRPLALFFFPAPPEEETIEKSLRAISENEISSLAPPLRYIFRKAKAFQLGLADLYEGKLDAQEKNIRWLQELSIENNAVKLAENVRKKLGVTIEEQKSWKDSDTALKNWRSILADNGIYVFKEAFKTDKISGFCIYDKLFPIIFINNSNQTENRQIFTLFHELGHLIYKDSYLDVSKDRLWEPSDKDPSNIEVKCNIFASQFLLPEADFHNQIQKHSSASLTDQAIREIAELYHVSRYVILRRFLDKKIITTAFYTQKTKDWEEQAAQALKKAKENKKSGGNPDNTKMAYLGDAYLSLVLSQYYNGSIGVEQASSYLDIKVARLDRIGDTFLERRSV